MRIMKAVVVVAVAAGVSFTGLAQQPAKQTAKPKPPAVRASQKSQFEPNAVVAFADGSAVEFAGFKLLSPQYASKATYYTQCSGYTSEPGDMLFKQGPYLKTIPFVSIRTLELADTGSGDWIDATLVTDAGAQLKGLVPRWATHIWLDDGGFQLRGESTVLGAAGQFQLYVELVKRVDRDAASTGRHSITDVKGNTTAGVRKLSLGYAYSCPRGRRQEYAEMLPVKVQHTGIEVPVKNIATLTFPEKAEGDAVRIRWKSGEETDAELGDVDSFWGKTASGQIWLVDLKYNGAYVVRSIQFK
jgi:hypothetical protein